jgi:hypothetical protein
VTQLVGQADMVQHAAGPTDDVVGFVVEVKAIVEAKND